MKLTFDPALKRQLDTILAPVKNPEKWKAMGLPFAPYPHAVIRLEGEPGTGKSATAEWIAKQLRKPPLHLDYSKVVSDQLGATEKAIVGIFQAAAETQTPCIIVEEADALMWSRNMVDEDTTYMLGFINTVLMEIDRFINRDMPSVIIFTTNHPEKLDSALESRMTDVIKLYPPKGAVAEAMWRAKLPCPMRTDLTTGQLGQLASIGATPRQMEKAILKIARTAILEGRDAQFSDFGI